MPFSILIPAALLFGSLYLLAMGGVWWFAGRPFLQWLDTTVRQVPPELLGVALGLFFVAWLSFVWLNRTPPHERKPMTRGTKIALCCCLAINTFGGICLLLTVR